MKVLFVASGNKNNKMGTVVQNQYNSLRVKIDLDHFLIIQPGFIGYFKSIFVLRHVLKNNKYILIHSHYSLSAFVSTIALILLPGKKIPHVVSLMGSDLRISKLYKIIVKYLTLFIWNATIVKSVEMSNNISKNKTIVIPNGVELNTIRNGSNGIRNNNVILFAASPYRRSKNFSLAELAIKELNNTNVEFKVVFDVSHNQIINEIKHCSVLLLTSLWEGSPNIIKEAMACNCPIVTTNVGDVSWIIGDTKGCYITTFNPVDIAEKLKLALLYSNGYGKTNGRERILKLGLDAESVAERIIAIYNNIIYE